MHDCRAVWRLRLFIFQRHRERRSAHRDTDVDEQLAVISVEDDRRQIALLGVGQISAAVRIIECRDVSGCPMDRLRAARDGEAYLSRIAGLRVHKWQADIRLGGHDHSVHGRRWGPFWRSHPLGDACLGSDFERAATSRRQHV